MNLVDPRLDDVVSRVYRASAAIDDTAIRELLRNAAVSLMRAPHWEATEHCVELIRSLLVTACELRFMDFKQARVLRDDVGALLEERAMEPVGASH